jgi:membrane-associated phospholipid phosphatase
MVFFARPRAEPKRQDADDLPRPTGDGTTRATFTRMVVAIVAVYLLAAAVVYLWRGTYFVPDPPDSWALLLLIGAIVLGRWKDFLRDWVPLVALIFGYELLRGFAGTLTVGGSLVPAYDGAVHYRWILDTDTWLFGGVAPTAWLQEKLYDPGVVHWYDALAGLMYSLHFALPLVFGYIIWVRDRDRFRLFTITLLFMTYTTFVVFLLYPTAPPWLVNVWGYLPGVHDPFDQAASATADAGSAFTTLTVWTKASPDPVAAFPSLHAAYPWLVLLFLVKFFGRRGWFFLLYNALLWFSIVYLAQHWVVDILGGIVWATATFFIVQFIWTRLPHQTVTSSGRAAQTTSPSP